ncbi:Ig-like domain-containing protein [Chloroflexota bacterium]
MKRKWVILLQLLTVIPLLVILSGSFVVAADPVATFLTVEAQEKTDRFGEEYLAIVAKLTKEDGRAVGGRTITFFKVEDYFGLSSIKIGTAKTTAVGTASVKYETLREGVHQIEAHFTGDAEYLPAKIASGLNITNVMTVENGSIGLQPIQNAGLMLVGAIVLVVWFLLAFIVFNVFFRISRAGS